MEAGVKGGDRIGMTDTVSGMGFRPVPTRTDGRSLAIVTAEMIEAEIESGRLEPGSRLPTERELIEMLQVSRSPLREALKMLEASGLIEAQVGRGRFVSHSADDAMSGTLVRHWLRSHRQDIAQLNEIRCALECAVLKSVPRDQLPMLAARLQPYVDEARLAAGRGDAIRAQQLDELFHRGMCDACPNPPLRSIAAALIEAARPTGQKVYAVREAAENSLNEHQRIVAAIAAKRLPRALQLLDAHHRLAFQVAVDADVASLAPTMGVD